MLSLPVRYSGLLLLSSLIILSNWGPSPVWQPVLIHTSFSSLRWMAIYGPSIHIRLANLFPRSLIGAAKRKAWNATLQRNFWRSEGRFFASLESKPLRTSIPSSFSYRENINLLICCIFCFSKSMVSWENLFWEARTNPKWRNVKWDLSLDRLSWDQMFEGKRGYNAHICK